MKYILLIKEDGTIMTTDLDSAPWDWALREGRVRYRASNVMPVGVLKRVSFRILRSLFGDTGRVSQWTRGWSGKWLVDFSPTIGGLYGPFDTRDKALEFERKKVDREILEGEQ